MIAELGHYALVLALALAAVQAVAPLIGAHRGDAALMDLARPAALGQLALIAFSFGALTHAYLISDFSVINVAENSHSAKPLIYKISGVWGNHEGSLLLWILILAAFGAALACFGRTLPPSLRARTLAVQAMIAVGFLLFILLTSNPFIRVPEPPLDGSGLNPLLQDPGLALHPPFLYLGYVGLSISYSFAVAALIEGRVDAAWARWVRPWTLAAWVNLTLGIGLGSWWAYRELGWGGWWFWDPVENASLLPWLVATALLHSAIVVEKRDTLKSWTILLAIIAFSLSLLGTFLVRSGVLTSVHAFATDPTRGVFILAMLVVAIGGSFALYAARAPALEGGGLFAPISREGGMLLNNLLLSTATATVLLGTLYPVVAESLNLGRVTVGPPFFNAVFIPLMVPLLAAMAVGPLLSWKRADLGAALRRLWAAFAFAAAGTVVVWFLWVGDLRLLGALGGVTLALWVGAGVVVELAERIRLFRAPWRDTLARAVNLPRAAWGMTVAHFGVAVFVLGVAATAWEVERIRAVQVGDTIEVGRFDFTLTDVAMVPGPNYGAMVGTFDITRDGRHVATVHPERRRYFDPPMETTQAAVHSSFLSDLYAVLGDRQGDGTHVARLYYKPLLPFLWYGGLLMSLGGLISLTDRRYRVGAPTKGREKEKKKTARPSDPAPAPAE